MEAFNSPHDIGRVTRVLLHMQHAFEMMLKSALVHVGVDVFDPELGRSLGFKTCLRKASAHPRIRINEFDAGTLRAIDAMRDDEQHWFNHISEQILYLHVRAGITLFADLLSTVFGEKLAAHLPIRVLPVSADPPRDLFLILDDEYSQIAALLKPGRRAGHEASARIRTLLAMEAHMETDTRVSRKDVDRVRKGIKNGASRDVVFPKLRDLATTEDGSGLTLKLRFTKNNKAPTVRYVADDNVPAAAIREVDLHRKYHRLPSELAAAVGLTINRAAALREHLGIDADESCVHVFKFGSQHHPRYSDKTYTLMKDAAESLDMSLIWEAHRPRSPIKCPLPDCSA
jgi:hypothetical protein